MEINFVDVSYEKAINICNLFGYILNHDNNLFCDICL